MGGDDDDDDVDDDDGSVGWRRRGVIASIEETRPRRRSSSSGMPPPVGWPSSPSCPRTIIESETSREGRTTRPTVEGSGVRTTSAPTDGEDDDNDNGRRK
jgi:hypothetical protein